MSITFGFYNSVSGDRRYNATHISQLFDGLIADGVFATVGDALAVSPISGMNLGVGIGRAWFNRTWLYNDAVESITIEDAEVVLDRIDVVILEFDSSAEVRVNSIKVVKGTPASTPVAPTLINNETLNQYPLVEVYVAAGVTEITAGNITNKIGTSSCPFVTGVIDTIDTDMLLAQWDDEFGVWFESIKDILDENVAGNLLNLINIIGRIRLEYYIIKYEPIKSG